MSEIISNTDKIAMQTAAEGGSVIRYKPKQCSDWMLKKDGSTWNWSLNDYSYMTNFDTVIDTFTSSIDVTTAAYVLTNASVVADKAVVEYNNTFVAQVTDRLYSFLARSFRYISVAVGSNDYEDSWVQSLFKCSTSYSA